MNNDFLEKRLKELSKLNFFNDLVINRGIEKEFFRVNRKGNISEREHPQSLGSALTNKFITTDFAEAQLELVTPTFDDIDDIYQKGMLLGNNTRDYFLPQIVEFCKTITNKQVNEMATYFDELMKERKLELENDEDDFQGSLTKSFKRFFRFMGVKLNNDQINTIRILSSGIEDTREQSISERIQWNQEFIAILNLRQNENFEEIFINHINSLDSENPNTRMLINQITAEIIASLDEKQRGKFQKRLGRFEASINQIIQEQN